MKTAQGAVDHAAPRLCDTPAPVVPPIRRAPSGRTAALGDLAVELDARGS